MGGGAGEAEPDALPVQPIQTGWLGAAVTDKFTAALLVSLDERRHCRSRGPAPGACCHHVRSRIAHASSCGDRRHGPQFLGGLQDLLGC